MGSQRGQSVCLALRRRDAVVQRNGICTSDVRLVTQIEVLLYALAPISSPTALRQRSTSLTMSTSCSPSSLSSGLSPTKVNWRSSDESFRLNGMYAEVMDGLEIASDKREVMSGYMRYKCASGERRRCVRSSALWSRVSSSADSPLTACDGWLCVLAQSVLGRRRRRESRCRMKASSSCRILDTRSDVGSPPCEAASAPWEGHLALERRVRHIRLDGGDAPIEEQRQAKRAHASPRSRVTLALIRAHQEEQVETPVGEPLSWALDDVDGRARERLGRLPIKVAVEASFLQRLDRAQIVCKRADFAGRSHAVGVLVGQIELVQP